MAIDDESAARRSAGQPPGAPLSGLVPDLVHDLRKLLAPMKNAIELLRLRSAGDNRFTPGIAILERQFDGLGQLLERLAGAEALHADATPAGGPGLAVRRVLVVDDNDAMRESLTGLLAELGQQVRSARDGEEALRIARDWRPDLVLLDINLPKLNGYRVARELRSEFGPAAMSMVMMTGDYPVEAVRRGAAAAGVARCIDKMQAGTLLHELLADPAA